LPDLTIRDLVVEYSSGGYAVRPIDGFDLDTPAGSLTILLGPSGSGKTTLLSCLGGILSPTSGTITFGDTDITALAGPALTEYRRHGVGIVFQAFNLVESLTASENVALPMRSAGVRAKDARRRAGELLDRVDLGDRADHRPGELSGGQQQRVAIARALSLDPPLLLADEPTAHLDYVQVDGVLKLLRRLADGERVIVVVTHDDRLVPLADQVVELVPNLVMGTRDPQLVELAAGDELFAQGDWGDLVYVIESGEIDIVRLLADGGEEHRATLTPGRYFGEIAPMFGIRRSASARARTDSAVTGYTLRDFRDHVDPLDEANDPGSAG
jgi:putative ABC transport system ATP-binding protein